MPTTYAAANLQWVGFSRETTYGTPVATPSIFAAVDSPQYHHVPQLLTDTNLRGSMAAEYEQVNGLFYDTLQFKTNWYLDSIFPLFRQALGLPDVVTGSSDPYTHKTSLQNGNNGQPDGTTLFWADAAGKVLQIPGAMQQDLKVTLKDAALANVDVTYAGLPATAITPPTLTQSASVPAPSWNTSFTYGGVAEAYYSEVDIEIKRASEMIPTLNGTQTPVAIFGGPVSVSGSCNAVYQGYSSQQELQDQLTNTQRVLTVKVSPVGDSTHYVFLQMSQVVTDDIQISGTNKWMEAKWTWKALANPTDVAGGGNQSPMLVTGLLPTIGAL